MYGSSGIHVDALCWLESRLHRHRNRLIGGSLERVWICKLRIGYMKWSNFELQHVRF